ncbi:MAG: heavy metal-binding domain-containing protein [Prochloraceae cyanobacterium]|nr:heavy metal-binding domain-containing protein [Prochloraceae cyanobacterium]
MSELLWFLALLALGYFAGTYLEKKHYKSIKKRERQTCHLPTINFGAKQEIPEATNAAMFVGSVVVSADYFKMFISFVISLFGGRIVVYETLLDRGRREALLRMKEQAIAWGATQILNVRLETSNIGDRDSGDGLVAIEIIAYGTGIQ